MSKFKDMSIGQLLGHFWFYYKWHTFAVIFTILTLAVCITQCANEMEADSTIGLYMNRQFTGSEIDILEEVLAEYCEDTNGDGQKVIKVYDFSYLETQQDYIKQLNKEKLMAELTGGTCVLYVTDSYQTKFFEEHNIAKETEYGKYIALSTENEILKKLTEKGFKKPEDLRFVVRITEDTVFENTNSKDKVDEMLINPNKILEQAAK